MNKNTKRACLLYRTDSTLPQHEPEMNRQRAICLAFAKQHGWYPVREFWEEVDDEMGPEKTEDALLELRAYAEQKKFDVLLVPQSFFERMGIEVWDVIEGRIINRPC